MVPEMYEPSVSDVRFWVRTVFEMKQSFMLVRFIYLFVFYLNMGLISEGLRPFTKCVVSSVLLLRLTWSHF